MFWANSEENPSDLEPSSILEHSEQTWSLYRSMVLLQVQQIVQTQIQSETSRRIWMWRGTTVPLHPMRCPVSSQAQPTSTCVQCQSSTVI